MIGNFFYFHCYFIEIYSGYHSVSSNYAWKKYFDILNNINLIFFDHTMPNEDMGALGYVVPSKSLYDVHINCSLDNPELLQTLVHEIQHLIYYVKQNKPTCIVKGYEYFDYHKKSIVNLSPLDVIHTFDIDDQRDMFIFLNNI